MFTLTEVASLNDIQPTYRILKPWWDVFMDYLGLVMLMLAIFAMTMQISKDQVACLPYLEEPETSPYSSLHAPSTPQVTSPAATTPLVTPGSMETKDLPDSAVHEIHNTHIEPRQSIPEPQPTGKKTNLDSQQYVFINQICYHVALPWYSKYFPYLTFIHIILLMVSSNFWFKYPKTSSKIEHFVSILGRCFESPWTTKALSETACEDSEENKQRLTNATSGLKQVSLEEKDDSTAANPTMPMLGMKFSAEKPIKEVPSTMTFLDKKDGEQAKVLFEKVRKFRAHVEDSDCIYKLYVAQTIVKTAVFISILSFTSTFLVKINFKHECKPEIQFLTGYGMFLCTNNMAFTLNMLLISYMVLILIYGITCLYSLFWVFRRPLKEYSFEKVCEESSFSDIPDVKNDFAFLLHMVDQCDQLYSKRFGVFLSEVSEPTNITELLPHLIKLFIHNDGKELLVLNSLKKMTSLIELELHNCELEQIPHAIFRLTNLQELDLKSNNIRTIEGIISFQHLKRLACLKLWHNKITSIPSSVGQVKSLESLYLNHNKLESLPRALFTLPKLRHLDLSHNSITVLSPWICSLHNLQYLAINMNKLKVLPEQLFRCTKLKVLCLAHNSLTTLPETIKQLVQLTQLELRGNCLDRLPATLGNCQLLRKSGLVVEDHLFDTLPLEVKESISRETNVSFTSGLLHMVDQCDQLYSKRFRVFLSEVSEPTNITELLPHLIKLFIHNDGKELLVLNSLKKMTSLIELELHNCELERIPDAIFSLTNLQELDLKSNNIRTIEEIISFQHLKRLACLKLWHNKITSIPSSIEHVKSLESLYLNHNKLESLHPALFTLPKLRHLDLSHNSITVLSPCIFLLPNIQYLAINMNKLEVLPEQLFRCTKLKVLCLAHNALTTLPETIEQLVQLTQLELRENCLDRLPATLGNCQLLRKSGLVVEDHLFDTLPLEVKESISRETNVSFTSGL